MGFTACLVPSLFELLPLFDLTRRLTEYVRGITALYSFRTFAPKRTDAVAGGWKDATCAGKAVEVRRFPSNSNTVVAHPERTLFQI